MNNLLIVVPYCAADCALAERMIDWIYLLNLRRQSGHCLLANASDVHPEMQAKLKLAAEVTFESVDVLGVGALNENAKSKQVNHLFMAVAQHIAGRCKAPWLWLEPDCVPLTEGWAEALSEGYYAQPKRYYGSYLKFPQNGTERATFARTGIYPPGTAKDLKELEGDKAFHVLAADVIIPRSSRCRMIQQLNYTHESDPDKIRPDAVLLHSDKTGAFIADRREALDARLAAVASAPMAPRKRGRPRKDAHLEQTLVAPSL